MLREQYLRIKNNEEFYAYESWCKDKGIKPLLDITQWPRWKEYQKNQNATIKHAYHWALWIHNIPFIQEKHGLELDEVLMNEIIKVINKDAISQQDFDEYVKSQMT